MSLELNRKSTFQLLQPIVDAIDKRFFGKTIEEITETSWKITACNTLWITKGFEIEIGENTYKIKDFLPDEWILIEGEEEPETIEFEIYPPKFFHGTIMIASAENAAMQQKYEVQQRLPMIYLQEVTTENFNYSQLKNLDRESDAQLYFLVDANFQDWTQNEHDIYAIKPMRNLAFAFIKAIEESRRTQKLENFTVTDHAKWGVLFKDGHSKNIFSEQLSGCGLRIRIPFFKESCINICAPPSQFKCLTLLEIINKKSAEYTAEKINESNKSEEIKALLGDCEPATVLINGDEFTTIISGGSQNIEVVNSENNQVGSIIDEKVVIGDNVILIENTAGHIIETGIAVAEENKVITVPDITFTDSNGNQSQVPAGIDIIATLCPAQEPCEDAIANVRNSEGTLLATQNIPSGQADNVPIPDITLTVNGVSQSEPAGKNISVFISTEPYKTGQTISYATGDDGDFEHGSGSDYLTLDLPNVFGNLNRFTDLSGGQNYPNDIVLDHSQKDKTERIFGIFRIRQGVGVTTQTTAVSSALSFSAGGFNSGWFLPTIRQLQVLQNWSQLTSFTDILEGLSVSNSDRWLWSSNTNPANSANGYCLGQSLETRVLAKTGLRSWTAARYFTLNELGL